MKELKIYHKGGSKTKNKKMMGAWISMMGPEHL
jgi:hypothetical protein